MSGRSIFVAALVAAGLVLPAASAHAQQARIREGNRPDHSFRLDVHGNATWWGSFGAGLRFEIPIVPDGFIAGVDDELALSPGFELLFIHAGAQASQAAPITLMTVQWSFWLSEMWSVFAEVGGALIFANWGPVHHRHRFYDGHTDVGFTPVFNIGGRLHLSPTIALLMRVGWPMGGEFGVVFHF